MTRGRDLDAVDAHTRGTCSLTQRMRDERDVMRDERDVIRDERDVMRDERDVMHDGGT